MSATMTNEMATLEHFRRRTQRRDYGLLHSFIMPETAHCCRHDDAEAILVARILDIEDDKRFHAIKIEVWPRRDVAQPNGIGA